MWLIGWCGDETEREIEALFKLGLDKFIVFPAVEDSLKDKVASYSYAEDNFYLKVACNLKEDSSACLISDVAMDPYSSDGHDGYVENGRIVNDVTLPILQNQYPRHWGPVLISWDPVIWWMAGWEPWEALDEAGYYETNIMSYTAKYASAFTDLPRCTGFQHQRRAIKDLPDGSRQYLVRPWLKEAGHGGRADFFNG